MQGPPRRNNLLAALEQALAEAAAAPPRPPVMSDPGLDDGAAMEDQGFHDVARAERGLQLLALLTLPDGRLFRGWRGEGFGGEPRGAAASMAALVLAHGRVTASLGGLHDEPWATLETRDALLLVRPLRLDFALGALFDPSVGHGSARVSMRRLVGRIAPVLPGPSIELEL